MTRNVRGAFVVGVLSVLGAYAQPKLAVDASAARHPISPYIYGINEWPSYNGSQWTDSGMIEAMRVGVRRWGGDNATSYNWQIDVSNLDSDWYFANYVKGDGVTSAFHVFHERNLQTGTLSLGTVPVLDWTPKLIPGQPLSLNVPLSCSYSVKKYGAQKQVDPYDADCGNGVLASTGKNVVNDPNDDYQAMTPSFAGQWVQSIMSKYGAANLGGVQVWSLDNEPEWWDAVHPDIYSTAATYDDMMARNIATAKAVKTADPTALISGPVQAGWPGMLFSKKDIVSGWNLGPHYQYWANPLDYKAHGSVPWLQYYLQQMHSFEQANGYRLLDYLDVHAYIRPDALGEAAGDATTETLRLTSTRAFWDPNYILPIKTTPASGDPCDNYDAICDATGAQVAPQMIRNMSQWVAENYPGTKLAITEYNWGALASITGAVAQADILGIFGREGLDLGTVWPAITLTPSTPGSFAFQMFVNYDGAGNQFGETSISATTDNPDTLSVFAAQRSDTALTVMVMNKTTAAITTSLSLANFTPAGTAQVWQYSGANLSAIVRQADVTVSGGVINATFPSYSVTLFVIPASQSAMPVSQPVVTSVGNLASGDTGGVSPGEMVLVAASPLPIGGDFASIDIRQFAVLGRMGTSLVGVRVLFNGLPAPVLEISSAGVSAIVPYEAAFDSSVQVQVENQGNRSAPLSIPVTATRPGVFTQDGSGGGQAVINLVLGSQLLPNGPGNPVVPGDVVAIDATGEGITNPPGLDGRIAGAILPVPVATPCSVTMGGVPATVSYCGAESGQPAGRLQVQAQVPASVPIGSAVPVVLSIGSSNSQTGATMVTALTAECSYGLSLPGFSFPAAGGTGSITVTARPSCAWTATSDSGWLTVTSASLGSGNGTVTYQVTANTSTQRSGTLTIGGSAFPVTQLSGAPAAALQFVPVPPCRVVDTRNAAGPFGGPSMTAAFARSVAIPLSACGIPATALAYSLNVTVVPEGPLSYLTLWPAGQIQPLVSTLNSFGGIVVANAAIVPAGSNGAVSVYVTDPTDVILDINGYFELPGIASYSFYPATPCRVADTRNPAGTFGGPAMQAGQVRTFPVPSGACDVPPTATAYSLNATVVPAHDLGYLTAWPTGGNQPVVSTLNSPVGEVVANAALVPSGTNGAVSVFVTDPTDVVLDVNGYFGQPGNSGALSFYPVTPCRIADTRTANGPFGGPEMTAGATRTFAIPASACNIPATAAAYSLNVTVVPDGPLGYLSAWPAGANQPLVSTLNSPVGAVVANAAIVPAGNGGAIDIFVTNQTHVILDINGYFAP